ncbi:hypothetical protein IMZ48_39915 [Candidatus Bathyarchaeota archaeon]|nr:hypothetical protein [Candidatus Bathyarchaeota archaeon]
MAGFGHGGGTSIPNGKGKKTRQKQIKVKAEKKSEGISALGIHTVRV